MFVLAGTKNDNGPSCVVNHVSDGPGQYWQWSCFYDDSPFFQGKIRLIKAQVVLMLVNVGFDYVILKN